MPVAQPPDRLLRKGFSADRNKTGFDDRGGAIGFCRFRAVNADDGDGTSSRRRQQSCCYFGSGGMAVHVLVKR
jgi:hypothetical protein